MSLAGKCALITGSTGGLGRAAAERFAAAGCNVVLNGIVAPEEMTDALRQLEATHGIKAAYHRADLRELGQIAAMMQAVIATYGAVDILVNNAVVRHFSRIEDFPVERWNEALAVNLSAVFHTIRLALPAMRQRAWGRIINVASPYSFFATPNRIDYVTTKTGLLGLTRTVALETVDADITCNAVCPGTLPTSAIESKIRDIAKSKGIPVDIATHDYLAERQPGGRFISLDAVTSLMVYLCGPNTREINGVSLPVDNGWS
ncbi:MAG: SDR family NAD(P)-dependent oxidoreductase [Pseudolabrys sp.]